MIEVRHIKPEETYPLRIEILRNGIAQNYQFSGDDAEGAFHVGVFVDGECVGIGSCLPKTHEYFNEKNTYQLRGMAVKRALQKKGIGQAIVEEVITVLKEQKVKLVWFNARESALGFYEKTGFKVQGDRFYIPDIGHHFVMYKYLP